MVVIQRENSAAGSAPEFRPQSHWRLQVKDYSYKVLIFLKECCNVNNCKCFFFCFENWVILEFKPKNKD